MLSVRINQFIYGILQSNTVIIPAFQAKNVVSKQANQRKRKVQK